VSPGGVGHASPGSADEERGNLPDAKTGDCCRGNAVTFSNAGTRSAIDGYGPASRRFDLGARGRPIFEARRAERLLQQLLMAGLQSVRQLDREVGGVFVDDGVAVCTWTATLEWWARSASDMTALTTSRAPPVVAATLCSIAATETLRVRGEAQPFAPVGTLRHRASLTDCHAIHVSWSGNAGSGCTSSHGWGCVGSTLIWM
jgi:hypothetical protein